MSDIWHTPIETPDVFKSHPIIVVYEAGDQIEQMDSKEYSNLVGERYVNRWCYVDDLIKENERTRKALDIAVDALKDIRCVYTGDQTTKPSTMFGRAASALNKIQELEQITALEQKD